MGEYPLRLIQASLLASAAGAVVILLGLFGEPASWVGLAAIVGGTIGSAPGARSAPAGEGWWRLLAAGAAISIAGAALALGLETIGGLLAAVGSCLVVIGAAIGFPLGRPGA